jgi:heparanase 1
MEGEEYARKLKELVKGRELWLTETASALYGGEGGVSDTYASTLFWLNLLGSMARSGVSRVFRQTLVGSDYGLLDPETFEPRPDYFVTFLWKKLMGGQVFALEEPPLKTLRWYCHATRGKRNRNTFVMVNHSTNPVVLETPFPPIERYILSPAGPLTSHYLLLNGELVEEDLVTHWRKKRIKEKYRILNREGESPLQIPPHSSAFLVLKT